MRTWSLLNWGFTHLEINDKGHKSCLSTPGVFVLYGKAPLTGYPKQMPQSLYLNNHPALTLGRSLVISCGKRNKLVIFSLSHPSIPHAVFSVKQKKEILSLLKTLNHLHAISCFHASDLSLNLSSNCPKLLWYQSTTTDHLLITGGSDIITHPLHM